jgi:glutamyl-tRNA synthetase
MSESVRVRYAPAPTGFQHIGNLRTALFNWLFARHEHGTFILRIEDTDRERSKEEYVTQILDDFRWLGLDWDEGPLLDDEGRRYKGDYGPYRQSERLEIYREYANRLLDEGKAYRCYCTSGELEERRSAAMKGGLSPAYDGRCRELSQAECRKFDAEGRRSSVRFRVPDDEKVTFEDMVLGETSFESRLLGDFVILKSDGYPTYHFGVVVDDALMKITHVIRAEGHLSNTPLHCLLFDGLGFARPRFAHLPSVLSADGKGKLSKRLGALSMVEYKRQGYLPEALVNFMALLGWSPGDDREFLTLGELIRDFSLERVKKSSARFDAEKLLWMNAKYIKQATSERLIELATEVLKEAGCETGGLAPDWMRQLVEVYRDGLKKMGELAAQVKFLLVDRVEYDRNDVEKILLKGGGLAILAEVHPALAALPDWSREKLEEVLKRIAQEKSLAFGKVAQPIRVAVTGTRVSKGIGDTLVLLGREKSLARMKDALDKFGKA